MHLLGPAYSTTQTKTKKTKLTDSKYTKYAQDWLDYNKQMKRLGSKTKTFEEYVAYRQGKKKYTGNPVKSGMEATTYIRNAPKYETGDGIGVTYAKAPNTYTGDKLIGIATMHKSNMVPIFSQEDAEDISKMRR
jgi:hypothetical protein